MSIAQSTLVTWFFAVTLMLPVGCSKSSQTAAGPPAVEVVNVVQKDVPITRSWVATLDGLVNAQIRAQVTGILLKQDYRDGAFVTKGTRLFDIDPRPFRAALNQANGNLQQAQANLQRAQARLGKTEIDDRSQPYHGYFFKILKGQGPDAPLGRIDFVVGGAMIGGFALAAAPADYRATGVKTFIVSYEGVVYQKDLEAEYSRNLQGHGALQPGF
jgi:hypothetical protein